MNNPRHTFSLEAFHSLLSRQATKVTESLSRPTSLLTDIQPCHHLDTSPTIYTSFRVVEDSLHHRRSIITESDCPDDDLRDDEGWIPISWSGTTNTSRAAPP